MAKAVRERLFLLDSMNYVFRAYHQPQTQSFHRQDGFPTGCVLVFHNMLRKLLEEQAPDYFAAVFESGRTFRDDLFEKYKANRAEMPDDLAQQLPHIRRLLEALRVPVIQQERYEADDVIATLATRAAAEGVDVYIVSGDKDMRQLVRPGVWIYDAMKNALFDAAKVQEVMGVPPERVVDVMALQGDSIDNIPGAPGIGEKGARDLIQRFGSVEATLERAAEVERKTYRESLLNNKEQILQSKVLATLVTDIPLDLDRSTLRVQAPDRAALRAFYQEMEFHSLLKDYLPAMESAERDYAVADSGMRIAESPGFTAIAVLPYEAEAALAFSGQAGSARTLTAAQIAEAKPFLEDESRPKAVHNLKSTLLALRRYGVELRGAVHDTLLYAYLLDPTESSYDLERLAERLFEARLSGSLAERADVIGQMSQKLATRVEAEGLGRAYREVELPLSPVLADMEAAGVLVDTAQLEKLSAETGQQIEALAAGIYQLCGVEFNINSPQQLAHVLFEKLKLPAPVRYGRGKVQSTAADILEELAQSFDVPRKVLEYRQLAKLKGTYLDALPAMAAADGRLHTSFGQAGSATGRLSSSDPNLQNVPVRTELGRQIRAAFIARPGWQMLSGDYSQIELRLLAHFSGDRELVDAFRRGEDIHARTAALVFGVGPLLQTAEHRRAAKAINFGIVYGLSAFGLAQQLGIEKSDAQKFINEYFARYSGVREFLDATLAEARQAGLVKTLYGRRRPIPDLHSRNANQRGFAERTAVNTPLQGSAADIIKVAMIRLAGELRRRGLAAQLLLQVHDELVLEAPETEAAEVRRLTKQTMEGVVELAVPLVAEVGAGPNWRDAK
jgi:DNA polymerase-1